jgi:hypothetical protein
MFFEERSTKILCRRVTYVAGGNNKTETVISFNKYARPIPDEVRDVLEEEELQKLQAWLDERDQKTDGIRDKLALDGLADSLRRSTKALEVPALVAKLTPEKVAALWAELDEMRRALRKAGHPKPKAGSEVE